MNTTAVGDIARAALLEVGRDDLAACIAERDGVVVAHWYAVDPDDENDRLVVKALQLEHSLTHPDCHAHKGRVWALCCPACEAAGVYKTWPQSWTCPDHGGWT